MGSSVVRVVLGNADAQLNLQQPRIVDITKVQKQAPLDLTVRSRFRNVADHCFIFFRSHDVHLDSTRNCGIPVFAPLTIGIGVGRDVNDQGKKKRGRYVDTSGINR